MLRALQRTSIATADPGPVRRFLVRWGPLALGIGILLVSVIVPAFEKGETGRRLMPLPLIMGLIAAAAGIFTNRIAAAWDKRDAVTLPEARRYFSNQFLPKLVGIALAMICRAVADAERDSKDAKFIRGIARRFEVDWHTLSKSDSAREFFNGLDDRALLAYVREPHRYPLDRVRWLTLLRALTGAGTIELSDDARDRLVAALNVRFGMSLRLALERDFALCGEGSMGLILDISRDLLNRDQPDPSHADNAAALAAAQAELCAAASRIEGKLDRYHVELRGDVEGVAESLGRMHGQIDEILDKLLARVKAAVLERDFATVDALLTPATFDSESRLTVELATTLGNRHYFAGDFDAAIEPYSKAYALREDDFIVRNKLALSHTLARLGDIAAHRRRAIELFDGSLALVEPRSRNWARTQNNLGNAWQSLPTGDRSENLAKAIEAYESALTVRTRAAHPVEWARTQNNIGGAWRNLPTGDRSENLAKAIEAYASALTVYTRTAHPVDWAMTQNNLGNAWQSLPTGDRSENLARAIEAYESALTVRTRTAHPIEWARTQNNLGNALRNLPTGDRSGNLARAIEAYESVLTVYTRAAHPVEWAATQNNLGIALADLPTGDRSGNLGKAIKAYESALTVYTRAAHPVDWAMTQNNLGGAWQSLPTGDRSENLAKSIEAYESVLTVHTRAAHPVEWAGTQNNLAVAFAELAEQLGENRCERLRQAIAAGKAALTVRTDAAFPREHAHTLKILSITRDAYEAAGCAADVAFDDITPAA